MRKKPATLEAHRLYYLVMAPLLSVLPETLSHSDLLTVLKRKNVFLEDPQDVFLLLSRFMSCGSPYIKGGWVTVFIVNFVTEVKICALPSRKLGWLHS